MTDNERIDFVAGNDFAKLAFLQNAQMHLMKPDSNGYLYLRLDGDFAAILRLQAAEGYLLADIIDHSWKRGYDAACDQWALR
jgi:hypothetical protein